MKLLYELFINLYPIAARLIAPFNPKAKLWISGRQQLLASISNSLANNTAPVIWMHCSSLGEFEQGLPVAEKIKAAYPKYKLLVTFFSPSGYTVRHNHPIADWVHYLPMDSAHNAREFVQIVQPKLAIFIKYEFWYHYLNTLSKQQIPTLLVSGIFRDGQVFFKWYGDFYRKMLTTISYFFVQDQHSFELLSSIGLANKLVVSGDTRFDRVIAIANAVQPNQIIEHFCNNHTVIVAGSTWSEDDKVLQHFTHAHNAIRYIVAPHDIAEERIVECLQRYPKAMRYSEYMLSYNSLEEDKVHSLVIDNMGMLSSLYPYATIAFIGGGFTDEGIHNTLEAAVYGVPIVFGPVYEKYLEAVELIDSNAAFSTETGLEMEALLNSLLEDEKKREDVGLLAKNYVLKKAGASELVLQCIQLNRLLTN